jgi:hypothetical protein
LAVCVSLLNMVIWINIFLINIFKMVPLHITIVANLPSEIQHYWSIYMYIYK